MNDETILPTKQQSVDEIAAEARAASNQLAKLSPPKPPKDDNPILEIGERKREAICKDGR